MKIPCPTPPFKLICQHIFLRMTGAGYSGTPLLKKLGITPASRVLLLNAPADYTVILGADISPQLVPAATVPDIIHAFVEDQKQLRSALQTAGKYRRANPQIVCWISWYKKSSKIVTDVTEDVIRQYALPGGWVDVKVCAVDAIWSGLKLVVPLKNR